jgi:hypothetical protein
MHICILILEVLFTLQIMPAFTFVLGEIIGICMYYNQCHSNPCQSFKCQALSLTLQWSSRHARLERYETLCHRQLETSVCSVYAQCQTFQFASKFM